MRTRSNPGMHGQVVWITGAGSGLGAATAQRLQAMGARLVLTDIDEAALATQALRLGPEVLALAGDVRDLAAMQALASRAAGHFGGLDMVWANAGIAGFGPVAGTDPAAWTRTVEVNLLGTFHTVRAALPFVTARRGHVAITASVASFVHAPGLSAYAASKAGVEALGNALRIELAHHGVTVGLIHPSWVATPMVTGGERYRSFRTLRAALPAPLRRDLPVDEAAARIADGLAARHDRVFIPRWVRLLRWLRTPLHTRAGERHMRGVMPALEAAYAADVAEHGVAGASLAPRPHQR